MAYTDQPQDIIRRLRDLETEITELRRQVQTRSSTVSGGRFALRNNSTFEIQDAANDLVLRAGSLGYSYANGVPQQGFEVHYEDGAPAIGVWRPGATSIADKQYTAIYNSGVIVASTDAASGFGLARPWLPLAFTRSDVASWPATMSSTYVGVLEAFTHQQHPWFEARLAVTGSMASTGDCRVLVDGNQIGEVVQFDGTTARVEHRIGQITGGYFGQQRQVTLELRRTAGLGTINATIAAWWRQSP